MEISSLEKFIESMDIEVLYIVERTFIGSTGKRYICIGVHAYYQKIETYTYYHCFEFTNQGEATYEDGNEVRSASESIFAYLGEKDLVDSYFKEKALKRAKREFEKYKYDY